MEFCKKIPLFLFFFLFIVSPMLFSMELEVSGGLGNLMFDKSRTISLTEGGEVFKPKIFTFGQIRLSGEHKNLTFNAGFEADPILRNSLFGNIGLESEYFLFEIGPFLGIYNTREMPFIPGISGGLKFQRPGVVFAQANASSSLAFYNREKTGHYSLYSVDFAAGFWLPNAICSLNMGLQRFTQRASRDYLIGDHLDRYFLRAHFFAKNVPFTLRLDLGYQSLKRSYTNNTDEIESIFAGFEGYFTINERLKIILGAEIPVYTWTLLPGRPENLFFQANAGIIWTFPPRG